MEGLGHLHTTLFGHAAVIDDVEHSEASVCHRRSRSLLRPACNRPPRAVAHTS
jgi:hypothetical protein